MGLQNSREKFGNYQWTKQQVKYTANQLVKLIFISQDAEKTNEKILYKILTTFSI